MSNTALTGPRPTLAAPARVLSDVSHCKLGRASLRKGMRTPQRVMQPVSATDNNTGTIDIDPMFDAPANGAANAAVARAAEPTASAAVQPAQTKQSPPAADSTADMLRLKLRIAQQAAALNRGALASPLQRSEMEDLIIELENSCEDAELLEGSPAPVEGCWELIYSSVEPFRSSPFFWAFQQGLVKDTVIARSIFEFTDAIPGAVIGTATQTISLAKGELLSEVDMSVFPGLQGTVVTRSTISHVAFSPVPNLLDVTVESTRVAGSNVAAALLDNAVVPVRDVFERLRGSGAARVRLQVTYADEDVRVSRVEPTGELFVYRKVAELSAVAYTA